MMVLNVKGNERHIYTLLCINLIKHLEVAGGNRHEGGCVDHDSAQRTRKVASDGTPTDEFAKPPQLRNAERASTAARQKD